MQCKDLLCTARTGTGKTAAFAIPILQNLTEKNIRNNQIKALILTPTRELAIQIEESFNAYGRHLRLRNLVIFGGVKQGAQEAALKKGVDILVATPGRLLDFISQGIISLKNLEIFVLDEADRMLDMGSVSYTHLDVYKRQVQSRINSKHEPRIPKLDEQFRSCLLYTSRCV